ncbi:hydroxycarboxylic acid receptor 3-like [Paralichthys olivaceus]|uniref:hydroxycarboxylic acid receptor 3-like n=1 Tax=Paralichthys olivaceus TaxID=8255 RepID=UPI00097DB265|nr:PREDICTED: hydroxycarboxylic acid receptor 3-like [Paralichthys olivaceus]
MQCHFDGTLLIRVLPPLLVTEIILGILGNGLALWIFCLHLKPWKSSTVLLFSLAMADFLLIMALPFRATYYMSGLNWIFGEAFCNICLFMLAMNRSGSIFFLMAIAVDRYMRVVHPHHAINSLSVFKAFLGSLAIWIVTIAMTSHIFMSKHFIPSSKHANRTYCESFMVEADPHHNVNWHKFEFLFSFYLPLIVILYCTFHIISHLRGRQLAQHAKIKKALCFITVVVVLFITCFLPSNIVQLVIWFKTSEVASTRPKSEVCDALEDLTCGFYISISLTYLNSVLDPVVYYFSIPAFKNICRKALCLPEAEHTESTGRKTRETGSQSLSQL